MRPFLADLLIPFAERAGLMCLVVSVGRFCFLACNREIRQLSISRKQATPRSLGTPPAKKLQVDRQ